VHGEPHSPQCIASIFVFVHVPLHNVGSESGQPETHLPAEHIGVLSSHSTPHSPQLVGCVMSVSHPSFGSSEQCAQPFAHDAALSTHSPSEHATLPTTFDNAVQSCPHSPQLRLSFGTHASSHSSCPTEQPGFS
jgi:hypothetical protein